MIANHPILGHNYSYHIRGDRSPLIHAPWILWYRRVTAVNVFDLSP